MKDIFLEKIIAHKKGPLEFFVRVMMIITTVTVILTINILALLAAPEFSPFAFMVSFGLIYLAYRLFVSTNIEYEYSLTNDDFNVESIIAKRKRKQVFNVSCKKFDRVAPLSDPEYIQKLESSTAIHDYSSSSSRDATWYIAVNHKGRNRIILFDYDDRFIEVFRRYNPRKVAAVPTIKTED